MADVLLFDGDLRFFSAELPPALRYLLHGATRAENAAATEKLLLEARARWTAIPDGHIALYKFYFVSARYAEAERAVWQALRTAARCGGFDRNYRRLRGDSANWQLRSGAARWYLFNLKALGVVRLRRNRVPAAQRVLAKLLELDPGDEIGGGAFLQIARAVTGDDEYDLH